MSRVLHDNWRHDPERQNTLAHALHSWSTNPAMFPVDKASPAYLHTITVRANATGHQKHLPVTSALHTGQGSWVTQQAQASPVLSKNHWPCEHWWIGEHWWMALNIAASS